MALRGNTIYCSSFSKTVAPGYRIGWVAAPTRYLSRILDAKAVKATYRNGQLNVEVPLRKELTAQTVPVSVEQSALAA